MKNKDNKAYMMYILAAVVVGGAGMFFALGGGSASTIDSNDGIVNVETGELAGPWTNTLVNYELITSDRFAGTDVAATAKVYDEQPEEWLNARGDFDDSALYTAYAASSGVVTINKEKPGMYYVVLTATGYNTEFLTIAIPDGTNRGDISDYQANPDAAPAELSAVGTISGDSIDFALANDTNKVLKDTTVLTIGENTEFKGWKVIVNDALGFSTDADGNGVYDEGIESFEVTVGSQTVDLFDVDNSVDVFDSNDEFTFALADVLADEADLIVKVEIKADTEDFATVNGETLGEGDGVISNIKIYNDVGSLVKTVSITA